MKICGNPKFNLTWVNFDYKIGDSHYRGPDNYPAGKYAELFAEHVFLDKIENTKKNCKWVWTPEAGQYVEENNSYTGALGLIATSQADIYVRPQDYFVKSEKNDLIDFSSVLLSMSYNTLQLTDESKTLNEESNLKSLIDFLIPSFNFVLLIVGCLVLYYGFNLLFLVLNSKSNRNLQLKTLAFFYSLFTFFLDLFINSNLNTSNVLVDYSDLLYSKEKVLESKKECCVGEDSSELDYLIKSPKNSFQYQIYLKMNAKNLCTMIKEGTLGNLVMRDPLKTFYLVPDFSACLCSKLLQTFFNKNTYLSEVPLYESIRAYVISRNMSKEKKKFINSSVDSISRFGFVTRLLRLFCENFTGFKYAKTGGKDGFYLFNNLVDYIEANTFVNPLSFTKLEMLFKIYFLILFLIIIVAILDFFGRKALKKLKFF